MVSIIGQPGIGKSRLIWEFEMYVDGIVESVAWHQGRSPAYGEGITFWALGEMVRTRAGPAETDDQVYGVANPYWYGALPGCPRPSSRGLMGP
jgi:hypothetical protein